MEKAFCTFIYGSYYRFIPYYIISIKLSYPVESIIILYNGTLPVTIKKYMNQFDNLLILENVGSDLEWLNSIKHKGAAKQSLRHVLNLNLFKKFKEIYFGDVDILILKEKEKENLFDFHKRQAKKNNLPFSNKVRPLPDNNKVPSKRLTGLHYIVVKPYFEKIEPFQNKFTQNLDYRSNILNKSNRNEEVLYYLCKDAFDFDEYKLLENKRPWHGFHLGLVRGKNFLNLDTIKDNSSLSINELKKELLLLNKNGEINDLLSKFYCREVYFTYKSLDLNLPFWIRLLYETNQLKSELIKLLKKLKKSV
jgi:hypothetical protein